MPTLIRQAIGVFVLLTVITGIAYPLVVTGIAQLVFPHQARGSLIVEEGRVVGSELVGQAFDKPGYFWGRPSATGPTPYTAFNAETLTGSSGSNHGPLNPALTEAAGSRIRALRAADPGNPLPIPVDLVTASGSGLDPHISPAAALYQVPRVARSRGMPEAEVAAMVHAHTQSRQIGLLGEPRVNVLTLNLALEGLE